MRSQTGGVVKTCLIFLPLIAIPLLAVFGIPDLSSVSESLAQSDYPRPLSADEIGVGESTRYTPHDLFAPLDASRSGGFSNSAAPTSALASQNPNLQASALESRSPFDDTDPFGSSDADGIAWTSPEPADPEPNAAASAPATTPQPPRNPTGWGGGAATAPPSNPQPNDRVYGSFPNRGGNRGNTNASPFPEGQPATPDADAYSGAPVVTNPPRRNVPPESYAENNSPFGQRTNSVPSTAPSRSTPPRSNSIPAPPASWREVNARLKQLGIRQYQLLPLQTQGQYHFSCMYTSAKNPRITHRFEADAEGDLLAVQKVLTQVERWRLRNGEANAYRPTW